MKKTVLVAGSHGSIGLALTKRLLQNDYRVITASRSDLPSDDRVSAHLCVDMTQSDNVQKIRNWLSPYSSDLKGIIQCAGILHDDNHSPEKHLGQVSAEWLEKSMSVNVLPHLYLSQAVSPLINSHSELTWVSLSAKVASIEDNQLGGWYSYRMSKAALNMFIKTLSIEWGRRSKRCTVIAMHPGTTPSALSEPFTKNWPQDKLYSPSMTASRILAQFEHVNAEDSGRLYHHDGTVIPW
ncbi:cell-cell signaling protein CsgA [Enterovibrio norvegicus FF-162]|uniref:SDR family NAD(P)-dependent oxidoreductase n=1 Tax=Enterovibrio norvegicus TaxID=188144 RepID=UPI0002FEB2FF|nr:SDR family NAD(P)-dependent oxidoreductase [Enterovibrio norvegicus]OEE74910.1 cell-cell signaling protein CsgA [Enterovibrio norvegicus FF-162]